MKNKKINEFHYSPITIRRRVPRSSRSFRIAQCIVCASRVYSAATTTAKIVRAPIRFTHLIIIRRKRTWNIIVRSCSQTFDVKSGRWGRDRPPSAIAFVTRAHVLGVGAGELYLHASHTLDKRLTIITNVYCAYFLFLFLIFFFLSRILANSTRGHAAIVLYQQFTPSIFYSYLFFSSRR